LTKRTSSIGVHRHRPAGARVPGEEIAGDNMEAVVLDFAVTRRLAE